MFVSEFNPREAPRPLLYPLADSPHATIESNRNCNMACRACYNLEREHVKPLRQILEEIDALAEKRNLGAATILGGEPTLHPGLAAIVLHVKRRGLMCQLLTNGKAFLDAGGAGLLDRLAAAGIDKIILHLDSGQGLTEAELEARRLAVFTMLEARRVRFSLAITVYPGETGAMAKAIRRYSGFRFFDGVLAVLARGEQPENERPVQMGDVCEQIASQLGIFPLDFIPSSRADDEVCWLIYLFFVNGRSGEVVGLPAILDRLFRALYRFFSGRHFFTSSGSPGWAALLFLAVAAGSAVLCPAALPRLLRLNRRSSWLRRIRFHYIAVQEPPLFDAAGNLVRICRHCPDATLRNGRLTPVCIADYISPLNEIAEPPRPGWRRLAYDHLGEPG